VLGDCWYFEIMIFYIRCLIEHNFIRYRWIIDWMIRFDYLRCVVLVYVLIQGRTPNGQYTGWCWSHIYGWYFLNTPGTKTLTYDTNLIAARATAVINPL
jgi:hypothetical protein